MVYRSTLGLEYVGGCNREMAQRGGDRMKIVFISQPMAGKTSEEIQEERWQEHRIAEKLFPDEELVFMRGIIKREPPYGCTNVDMWYLGQAILCMAEADVAMFTKGWEKARECKIEHEVAIAYGLDVKER